MPTALGMAGGRLILAGNDGYRGEQFWAVDATGAATRLSSAAMPSYGEPPRALGNAGGRLVFRERGSSVWSSDGSAAGTQRLNLYLGDAAPLACSVGGRVVMLDRYSFKAGLVATDGTPANTVKVAELDGVENAYAASGGGYCYFGIHGHAHWKIWRSDGTAAGTSLWRESTTDSRLCGMAMLGLRVYVLEQRNGVRLVDAEEQAVRLSLVQDQCRTPLGMWVAAGRLVFFAPQDDINNSGSRALYVSDGTSAGTRPLALPANVYDWQTLKMAGIGEHVVFSTGYTATYSIDPVAGSITALPTYLEGLEQSDLAVLDGAMLLSANDGIQRPGQPELARQYCTQRRADRQQPQRYGGQRSVSQRRQHCRAAAVARRMAGECQQPVLRRTGREHRQYLVSRQRRRSATGRLRAHGAVAQRRQRGRHPATVAKRLRRRQCPTPGQVRRPHRIRCAPAFGVEHCVPYDGCNIFHIVQAGRGVVP